MWTTRQTMRVMNAAAAMVMFSVVIGAVGIQLLGNEAPCPLCLLIRMGMLGAGFGLSLNALWRPRPLHYGIALLGSVLGAATSLRQVALHVVPGTGSYGSAVFGFHLYTWAFIVFSTLILAIGAVLCFQRQFDPVEGPEPIAVRRIAVAVVVVGLALSGLNFVLTTLECGVSMCPDNPTRNINI
jgi:disulfide bond formation protein DsbB